MEKPLYKKLTLADIENAIRELKFPEDTRNYAIVNTDFGNIKIKV